MNITTSMEATLRRRVALLKAMSISRLELNAALFLTRLLIIYIYIHAGLIPRSQLSIFLQLKLLIKKILSWSRLI